MPNRLSCWRIARSAACAVLLSVAGCSTDPFVWWTASGTVLGPDGPLQGVEVSVVYYLYVDRHVAGSGVSDANGRFVVEVSERSCGETRPYGLDATHPMYAFDRHEGFSDGNGNCPPFDVDDVRVFMVDGVVPPAVGP